MSASPQVLSCISEEKKTPTCLKCQQKDNEPEKLAVFNMKKMMIQKNKNQLFVFNEKFQSKRKKLEQTFDLEFRKEIKKMETIMGKMSRNENMKYLNSIFYKFFTNKLLTKSDFMILNSYELDLFKSFIQNKRMYFKKTPEFYLEHPEKVKQMGNVKRVEENLKFIFRKLFKLLREIFNNTFRNTLIPYLLPKYRSSIRCDDYAFYAFFFEETAMRLDTKIEKFFEPCIPKYEDAKDECSSLIRKTISKLYLKCIKHSDFFMGYLNKFIEKALLDDIRFTIQKKLNIIFCDWKAEEDLGVSKESIDKKIKKMKFSWTVKDIEIGIKHLFEYLGDISD